MATQNRQQSSWEDIYQHPGELVQEYPMSTTLVAFGIGLGVGLMVGQSLAGSFSSDSARMRSKTEAFGQQICDALRTALPEAVSRHLPR